MSARGALWRATGLGRPVAGRLVAGVLLSAVAVGAAVALMATSGYLIARAAEMPPILHLTVVIVGVRFFSLLRAVARYLERLVTHDAALRVLVEARVVFLRRILGRPAGTMPQAADLMSRAVADVDRLQHIFVRALAPPVVAAVVVAATALAAALMLPAAAVVLLVALSATAVAVPLLAVAVTRRANRRQAAARAELAVQVTEAVAGAPELVALGLGDEQARRVGDADAALQRLVTRDALGTAVASAVGTAASWLTVVALLFVAVPAVGDGTMDGVLLAALALMSLAVFEAVNGLPVAAQGIAATADAARRLEDVAGDDTAGPAGGTLPSRPGPLHLEVRDAVVRPAPGAVPAVRGVDLTVAPGERVALVGSSGCGKSTLTRALVGLLPLESGTVSIDGVPMEELDGASVRDRIRLCDQDAHLFATTVAENVRLARPAATDDEVREALRRVGLGPWLAGLPGGMHTDLGDDGARVSGGQRQRIALARGVLAGPDLLVVDEPTSHLDDQAAREFLDDLLAAPADTGVLMTTHRMEGLERFDRVVVMREGRVVEDGPPAELASSGTDYPRMLAAARLVDGI